MDQFKGNSRRARPGVVLSVVALLFVAATAGANETDQFTLPAADDFADMGPEITGWYYEAIGDGVARANQKIRDAIARRASVNETLDLQSGDSLVNAVDSVFLRGNDIVDGVEAELRKPYMLQRHPGRRTCFLEVYHDIYYHAFWIWDPRMISRLYMSSTLKAFGTYFGTDKFGHFSAIGISYYWSYRDALKTGHTEAQALRRAVANGTTGFQSESGVMGITTTGDYANADLSANYAGFLFFRNLTEPVEVHGRTRPPMVVRDGPYWRLAPHVRRDSDFFAPFISDHWNEALNPGYFIPSMRPRLRDAVRDRTATILRYYRRPDEPPTAQTFRIRRLDLQTYWGRDYGHRGTDRELVTIDRCCFGG